jgi:hypothetical protein
MAAAQKIKVDVAELIKAIEKKKAEAIKTHDQRAAKFERRADTYPDEVVNALSVALEEAKRGRLPKHSSGYRRQGYGQVLNVPIKVEHPGEAPRKLDTSHFDRDIKLLKLAVEPQLIITANSEFARYL